jgi:Xaa-Pro aminopeptidase
MQANMVFTVEPGIYIPAEGFGIRLEDDVVIQPKWCDVPCMKYFLYAGHSGFSF